MLNIGSRTCRSTSFSSATPEKGLAGMTSNADDCRSVYDNWASDYGKDVEKWGYDMPSRVASLVARHLDPNKSPLRMLDAGAGDGLSGMALRDMFPNSHLTAVDLSSKMIDVAEKRGCYNDLQILDLNQPPFSFQPETFDAITCVGTMTYVDPAAGTLNEFCRLVKTTRP